MALFLCSDTSCFESGINSCPDSKLPCSAAMVERGEVMVLSHPVFLPINQHRKPFWKCRDGAECIKSVRKPNLLSSFLVAEGTDKPLSHRRVVARHNKAWFAPCVSQISRGFSRVFPISAYPCLCSHPGPSCASAFDSICPSAGDESLSPHGEHKFGSPVC